ncbi:HpcH/HpaI aldolase/citrate lyase family protein [Planosporangium sp. 12N6]|uniref:HpcH/HpaI aldolase/citrate lyase family protein n=1 Tax=Planosporangium spinosum TaxID=3402278 RepID=UPI003CEF5EC5
MARRVCLSVPGVDERKITKAAGLGVDEIVLDLEDSVPPAGKAAARQTVRAALSGLGGAQVAVRVNAVGTPWCHEDIIMCADGPLPQTIIVPKVESAHDLAFVDRLLDGVEAATGRRGPVGVQALIETAQGLARLDEIAAASPRLRTLILGYADLAASLGRAQSGPWLPVQDRVLVAARANGVVAIDGPYLGVADDEDFRAHVRAARDLGFDGKWVIHPRQVDAVREAFTPSAEQVRHAREVLAALDAAAERGAGAVELNGQMLDEAIAAQARRTLERAGE